MTGKILKISDDFWNIRGSFKVGPIDIGTQSALVRRHNDSFIFLDSYTLSDSASEDVDQQTKGRDNVEAILNVHPFHTIHVEYMHQRYPQAKLYGTARHKKLFPHLPWQTLCTNEKLLHEEFSDVFEFSVPRGVDFISENENVHFSSVLVYHRDTNALYVDDTLMYLRYPSLLRWCGLKDRTSFHLTLAKALEKKTGASEEFRGWAKEMITKWADAEVLCAAHMGTLVSATSGGPSIGERMTQALERVEGTLNAHERKFS
ncbi:MAG: hypothetical protein AAF438_13265 [Pseudomonadota bacterium]